VSAAPGDADAQRERAQQAWELVVDEAPEPAVLATLRRVLRAKRFELPALAARLPGAVRRGARVDLAPLEQALSGAGLRCELRRRAAGDPPR
jgi:hypothetical protein